MAKALDPTEAPRRFYGEELKRLREAAGLTQEALGKLVFCSGAYIGQIEQAIRNPQKDMPEYLDKVLGTDGHFQRLYEMVRKSSRYADYFIDVAELQSRAETISEFPPLLVPGLLQASGYARCLFEAAHPLRKPSEIEPMVALRVGRSELFDRANAPQYWAILDEAVLRRPVGGASVMRGQLVHLAELVRNRKAIIQVVPFSVGAVCADGQPALPHDVRRCAADGLLRGVVHGQPGGRSGAGRQVFAGLRSGQGRCVVAGGVPGPDRIGGGEPRECTESSGVRAVTAAATTTTTV
ncbi:helix-turn-helix domain-containing protein [Kitasatospora sp. NPDC001159]